MCRNRNELMLYYNEELMMELNEMMIRIKVFVCDECESLRDKKQKPTINELDSLHMKIHRILMKDCRPLIK